MDLLFVALMRDRDHLAHTLGISGWPLSQRPGSDYDFCLGQIQQVRAPSTIRLSQSESERKKWMLEPSVDLVCVTQRQLKQSLATTPLSEMEGTEQASSGKPVTHAFRPVASLTAFNWLTGAQYF